MSGRIITSAAALAVGGVLAATALAQAKESPPQPVAEETAVTTTSTPETWAKPKVKPVVVHVTKKVIVKAKPAAPVADYGSPSGSDPQPAAGSHERNGDDQADRGTGDSADHGDEARHGDDEGEDAGHDAGDDHGDGQGEDAGDHHGDDDGDHGGDDGDAQVG